MTVEKSVLLRSEEILKKGETILAGPKHEDFGVIFVDGAEVAGFRTMGLSFIGKVFGHDHSSYKEFDSATSGMYRNSIGQFSTAISVYGAVHNDLMSGWIGNLRHLLRAEVFSDFLDMAEHLLEQGYKDPAAVMIGSVLEDHLRQLATQHNIRLTQTGQNGKVSPKKADTLNGDLRNQNVYNKLDQKQVTAWLDLRNNAAHGHYGEYTAEHVKMMLAGVLDFIRRNGYC
jgi:hypothetical protein